MVLSKSFSREEDIAKLKKQPLVYLITSGEFLGSGGLSKYVTELTHYLVNNGFEVKVIFRLGKILSINSRIHLTSLKSKILTSKKNNLYMIQHLPNPLTIILGIKRLLTDIKSEARFHKVLHAHDISSSLLIAFFMKMIFDIPFIVQIHGFPIKEQRIKIMRSPSIFKKFVWFLTKAWHAVAVKIISFHSNFVIVNNSEVKSSLKSLGVPSEKMRIIPSAIDLKVHERFLLSRSDAEHYLGLSKSHEFTLGYVGPLRPEKNVNVLIKSFASFLKVIDGAKARLIIIGDGPERTLLKEATINYGIQDHVYFLGYVPEAYRFMNAFDVFVFPSLSEGSPFALLEAMMAGKAIIASDIAAIKEIVENGKEALLFNPHDAEQLKKLIIQLYNNPELRRELGENARKKVKQYDINIVFKNIITIIYDVLNSLKSK